MGDNNLPAERSNSLWHDLKLPDAAKTFAADITIRRDDWLAGGQAATDSAGLGSGESVSDNEGGRALRQRLAALPTVSIGDSSTEAFPPDDNGPELSLIEELGRGGMGVVLRAQQRSLERDVAVKRLRAKRKTQQAVNKLLDEARVTGSLEHPNIVPIHALGADGRGDPVLIMKRIEGVVWRELIRQPDHRHWQKIKGDRLPFHLEVLMQVCRALEFAHSRGVLHRDVKPENVMLGDFGEVYLLDWGLGLRLDRPQDAAGLGASDGAGGFKVVGTPSYMAPEMLTGAALSERTDVFLVGATLFEVLTGKLLNGGDNLYDVIMSIGERKPYVFDDSVPAELAAICHRATAIHPDERFADIGALREAIDDYLQHRAAERLIDGAEDRLKQLMELRQQRPNGSHNDDLAPVSINETHAAYALRVRKLAAECRFAFQQALSIWQGSPRGQQGLQQALLQLIELEIEDKNEAAARALFNELRTPADDAKAQIEQLAARLRAERQKHHQLEELVHEQDIRVEERTRGRQLLGLMVPAVAVAALVIVARRFYGWELSYRVLIVMGVIALIAVLGLIWLSKARVKRNLINRRVVMGFFTICSAVLLVRIGGWRVGAPIDTTLLSELMIDALGGTMLAVLIDNRLLKQSAFAIGCTIGGLILPGYVLEFLAAGSLGALSWLAIDWVRSEGHDIKRPETTERGAS